jgi:hypothetical protein
MLGLVGDWAREHDVMPLYAWSQWGRVVVVAEYLKRFDDAIALGEQAIEACASSPRAVFWLSDICGHKRSESAR